MLSTLTPDICRMACKYGSSFSAFFRNLITCSGSSRFRSLGQPPSAWRIPCSVYSALTVFAYKKTVAIIFTIHTILFGLKKKSNRLRTSCSDHSTPQSVSLFIGFFSNQFFSSSASGFISSNTFGPHLLNRHCFP